MNVAVVVPFHREPAEWLRACFESVRAQTSPADLIAVGDGWQPLELLELASNFAHRLIALPRPHRDFGNAARAIGALEAVTAGYEAVAFLDADNWFSPLHVQEMLWLHRETGAPICTASQSVTRVDGSPFGLKSESDGDRHVDTSAIFVTREAFPVLANWALIPPGLAMLGDRVWWWLAKTSGYKRAHSTLETVFYRNRHAAQYRALGEEPPAGTKDFPDLIPGKYSIRVPAMSLDFEIRGRGDDE